jgi:hypothetical protein
MNKLKHGATLDPALALIIEDLEEDWFILDLG